MESPKLSQKKCNKNSTTASDHEDEAYKPILQGVINTRCNYDGSKIDGLLS